MYGVIASILLVVIIVACLASMFKVFCVPTLVKIQKFVNRLRNIDEEKEDLSENENICKREKCMKKFVRQGVAVGIPK